MTKETKPERQSVEEIATRLFEKQHGKMMCLCIDEFICLKHQMINETKEVLQSERSIADNLREENEALKKRVDSEYDRGIEDAAKLLESKQMSREQMESDCNYTWTFPKDIAEAILKLRRG